MFKSINYEQDIFNKLIFIYIILDFLLTYLGINYLGCLEEANPLMSWLFQLPFGEALVIRVLFAFVIYLMYRFIQNNANNAYKKIVIFAILIESFVLMLHIKWIIQYTTITLI